MTETPYQRVLAGREALYFLHIPRTAGTSTRSVLESFFSRDAICPWQTTDKLATVPLEDWRGYRFYRGHFGLDFEQYIGRRPLIVTMLRDPVDSAISAFFDAKRQGLFPEGTTLESFAASEGGASMATRFRRKLLRDPDRVLQEVSDDESVAMAIESMEQFHFVGVTERFDESMQVLAHAMGWQCPQATPRMNRTDRVRGVIEPSVRELIAERVAPERAIFERAKSLLDEHRDRMTVELLDGAHRERMRALPRVPTVDVDFEQPIPGTGWHAPESVRPEYPMRWTGPGNEATLDLPLATDERLMMLVSVTQPHAPELMAQIEMTVNGHPIPLHRRSIGTSACVLLASLPADVLRLDPDFTRIRFRWPRSVSKREADPGCVDERYLGLSFHELKIAPRVEVVGPVVLRSG